MLYAILKDGNAMADTNVKRKEVHMKNLKIITLTVLAIGSFTGMSNFMLNAQVGGNGGASGLSSIQKAVILEKINNNNGVITQALNSHEEPVDSSKTELKTVKEYPVYDTLKTALLHLKKSAENMINYLYSFFRAKEKTEEKDVVVQNASAAGAGGIIRLASANH